MPCTYGYAMTTRKAQGATLDGAVLYMDMMFRPASPGYAYVGASRVKHHEQLFYYGAIRRSDWIPVGEPMLGWQLSRSEESNYDSGHSSDATSGSDADPLEALMSRYEQAALQQSMSEGESDASNDACCLLRAPAMQESSGSDSDENPMEAEESGTDISEFDHELLRPMAGAADCLDDAVSALL